MAFFPREGGGPRIGMVAGPCSIFDCHIDFDPEADLAGLLREAPAKWVVYVVCDQADRPVQLLCVKNLRMSLKRRLSGAEEVGPTRRISYREVVRRIHWRRVDSGFEADWVYLEAARQLFPESYQGMVGFRPAWFVHVDPGAEFPRYTKTTDLTARAGMLIGPVEDKHGARQLIELVEDAFDLCRYYGVLTEAPRGKACAYKEMGRCAAPCDGSMELSDYRAAVARSVKAVVEPAEFIAEQTERMQAAAAELAFERAKRIRTRIEQARRFGQGAFRHTRRFEDFSFVCLQRGPTSTGVKLFLIVGGIIEQPVSLVAEPSAGSGLLSMLLQRVRDLSGRETTRAGADRVAMVASHLYSGRQSEGVIVRVYGINDRVLVKAYRDLLKQKQGGETEDEGVIRELQAM